MADPVLYSVKGVIEALDSLHGETVRVAGILKIEFEGDSLCHAPKAERRPWYKRPWYEKRQYERFRYAMFEYTSSLWAELDYVALGLSRGQFQELNGRHVVVTGIVDRENTGHHGLWPGALFIREITESGIGGA